MVPSQLADTRYLPSFVKSKQAILPLLTPNFIGSIYSASFSTSSRGHNKT